MDLVTINSQKSLDEILDPIKRGHSFIREVYALSASRKTRDGLNTAEADGSITWVFLVLTDDAQNPGVEFRFFEVEGMCFRQNSDLEIQGIFVESKTGNTHFEFTFDSKNWFTAKTMQIKIFGEEVWGNNIFYGNEMYFSVFDGKIQTNE
jgi:hypothetical protein